MRKYITLLFAAIFALLLALPAPAQVNSTTVADGTATNQRIPVYGSYLNTYFHSQIIYPAEMLVDMVGGNITSMRFYSIYPAQNYAWPDTMQERFGLAITTETTVPDPVGFMPDSTTEVYVGTLSIATGTMLVTFDTPFTYTGGNLLLDISTVVKGAYKSTTWYGINTSDYTSVEGYLTGGVVTPYRYKFIPKTTFTYTGGSPCQSPNNVTVTNITETTAELSFQPRPGQTAWQYLLVPAGTDTTGLMWNNIIDSTLSIVGLTENTPYKIYVRADCGTEVSSASHTDFRTLCAQITSLPVTWDFESDNAGGTLSYPLPACWQRTPNTNYPRSYAYGNTYARSGISVLAFHSSGTNGVGVMTEIDTTVLPINGLQLEFYARMHTSYTSATIEVGVLGDPEDISTFQPVSAFPINSTTYNEEPYRVFFNEFTGYGNLIGFRMTNPSTTIVDPLIDDVTLSEIPPCPKVMNMSLAGATDSSLTVAWYGLNDSYFVRYRKVTDTAWLSDVTYSDTIVLNYLDPNTEYLVEVSPNCDTITDDMFASITGWTACASVGIPYFIDFENDVMYHCWTVGQYGVIENQYMPDAYYPSVQTSSSYALSGSKYMELGAQGGSTAYFTAPKIDESIETLRLKINTCEPMAYFEPNVLGTFQLGLMTDPYDTATFTFLDAIPISGTTYSLHTYNFNQYNYTGSGYYIAFRYIGSGIDTDNVVPIYIDDITITVNAACDEPNAVSVSNITMTTATFSWNGNASAYKVYFRPAVENNYDWVDVPVGDSAITVNDLLPSTHYYYYIASICSDGSEAPSIVGTFMTECGVHSTFPYIENFDDYANGALPDCWQRIAGATESNYVYPLTIMNNSYEQYAHSAPTGFAFSSAGAQIATAILPKFSVNTSNLRLNFYARPEAASSGTLHVGYMTNPTDSNTFVSVYSIATDDLIDYGYQSYLVDFNNSNAPDTAYIAFRYYVANDYVFFIDDVTVDLIPDCSEPILLTSSVITSTSANLSWHSTADSLTLYYKPSYETDYYTETVFPDSTGVFVLSGLNPSTTYTWYLSILCDGDEYESETATFKTDCAGITSLPVSWGFESGNTAGTSNRPLPTCWHRTHAEFPYAYQSTLNVYSHTGTRALYFNTNIGNLYATLTPIDTDALSFDTLQLKFYACTHSNDYEYTFEVGVMDDPMDPNTFTTVQSVSVNGGSYLAEPFRVDFDTYTGTGNYIAMRCLYMSNANLYIDDITLQRIPECVAVENLTVTDTTTNSATVSWTISEDISTFIVEHKAVTETAWQSQTVSGTTAVLYGLSPNTIYSVRVKPDCDPNVPLQMTNFTTLPESIPDSTIYPTVVTDSVGSITQTTAVMYGTITDAGNQPITAQGFEWKLANAAAYQTVPASGTALTYSLGGLIANTGYTFRAFVSTADTTVYGADIAFTTLENIEPCETPTNLHVTPDGVHNESVEITWDDDPAVNGWNIRYGLPNGSWSFATSATNAYTILGLTGLTTYEIQVQADCGDGNLSDWSASISVTTTNIGIEEHLLGSIVLYPNPANEFVNVECTKNDLQFDIETVEVYDVYGKVVRTVERANNDSSEQVRINVSNLADGLYFVRVTTDKGAVTKTFVKK